MPKRNGTKRNGKRQRTLAEVLPHLDLKELSPMGRDLIKISAEYEASGGKMLTEKEIQKEIARRRGGVIA